MSRKTFYELLEATGISPAVEFSRIYRLFSQDEVIFEYLGRNSTLQDYINKKHFKDFSFRGTYTEMSQIINAILGNHQPNNIDFDTLFTYFEFLLAVFSDKHVSRDPKLSDSQEARAIIENITRVVKRTNHELHNLGDDANPKYTIIESNRLLSQAAELVSNQTVAFEMIEYNHYSMKGNLEGKRKTLNAIANYVEPILKSHALQKSGYGQLESDAGFLLNCFHIRHNNKQGAKAQDYIVAIDDKQLESWYDKAYNALLSVIIIQEEISVSAELNDLKQKYNWKR